MALNAAAAMVQGFTTLVESQVAAIQGVCTTLLDFTIGSILRSFVEAVAGVALFLQAVALQVAALTRAASSNGTDLDSYFADFGFIRLAATGSSGTVTFARFTATSAANLPVGTTVQSFDGTQQFTVRADPTNALYNATLSAYVLPAGTAAATVLCTSVTTGALTNVASGAITTIVQGVSGIDYISANSAFAGGANAETDPAFRLRFVTYLASLSKATRSAILYAVSTVQTGLSQSLVENTTYAGTATSGYFYDVVDDGSGNPPSSLISAVSAAIDANRALGISFSVFGPQVTTASVGMALTTASGYTHSTVVSTVQVALTAYIQSLGLGVSLSYSRLAQVAYDASPGVTNVTAITLNSATADLTATPQQRILPGAMNVT